MIIRDPITMKADFLPDREYSKQDNYRVPPPVARDCFDRLLAENHRLRERLKNARIVECGEWAHLGGDEWGCPFCGHVISTEGSWEHPLSQRKFFCENCGANLRGPHDITEGEDY